jgi:predicted dehydrogenase
MAEFAAKLGYHIVCDKPLAINATQARTMLSAVETAGVKHAYGTTSRYTAASVHTHNLLAESIIGNVQEIESVAHLNMPALLPYSWVFDLSQGGGMLNNLFTHFLGQVLYMTDSEVLSVSGEARFLLDRAPVTEAIHDFRELFQSKIDLAKIKEWHKVDSDTGYTVILQLQMPRGQTVSALFHGTGSLHPTPNYTAFHGTKGSLYLTGPNGPNRIQHSGGPGEEWQDIEIPKEISDALPQGDNHVQNGWNQLFSEFVCDIRGEGYSGYPTFRDGWIASEIIEIVLSNQSWTALPKHPTNGDL